MIKMSVKVFINFFKFYIAIFKGTPWPLSDTELNFNEIIIRDKSSNSINDFEQNSAKKKSCFARIFLNVSDFPHARGNYGVTIEK